MARTSGGEKKDDGDEMEQEPGLEDGLGGKESDGGEGGKGEGLKTEAELTPEELEAKQRKQKRETISKRLSHARDNGE